MIAAILMLLLPHSYAGDLLLSFGPSMDGSIGSKKVLSLGYELRWGAISLEPEAGTWSEGSGGFTYFGGATIGVHVETEGGVFLRMGFGPNVISQMDDRLSDYFEMHLLMRGGIDWKSWMVYGQFSHRSDGSISHGANLGLDVILGGIGIPL